MRWFIWDSILSYECEYGHLIKPNALKNNINDSNTQHRAKHLWLFILFHISWLNRSHWLKFPLIVKILKTKEMSCERNVRLVLLVRNGFYCVISLKFELLWIFFSEKGWPTWCHSCAIFSVLSRNWIESHQMRYQWNCIWNLNSNSETQIDCSKYDFL